MEEKLERLKDLLGEEFNDVYCDTCNSCHCDGCARKEMGWSISEGYADLLVDKIYKIMKD